MGEHFLDEVRGPFAVALLDPSAGRCLAARDGMGNRVASYVLRDDVFAVAVGIDGGGAPQLLDLPGVSAEPDPFRLAEYYAFGEVTTSATFFRDIRELLPGELLIVEPHGVRRRLLPRPRLDLRLEPAAWEEAVEELATLMRASVARAMGGHDNVAVWLSGGLDSSPIAALAADLRPAAGAHSHVHGVSWRLTDEEGDERDFIAALSQRTGIPVSWVDCDDALVFADLPSWPVHPATPEQTAFRWFHERSYARARALGATVVLTGFGGDQLYTDARRWFWTLLLANGIGAAIDRVRDVARRDGWQRALRSEILSPLLPKNRRLRRALPAWLTIATRRLLAARDRWPEDLPRARRPRQAERVLALYDARGEHIESWYAAQHRLELATPLRDFDLVQLLLALPDHFLQQGTERRPILRDAMADLLPEEVRTRPGKASFHGVLVRGMEGGRLAWSAPLLRSSQALWHGFVEAKAVDRWLAGDVRDDSDRMGLLQCIYAELWRFKRAGGELRSLLPR
jgi:asparagine synthase (glutamine-hydrolysing)